jgi:hypothetical protein
VSFRVASHIAEGAGSTFNPGEPSAGTSGPVWSLIIAAGVWGGLDAPLVAKTFDLVFSCLALFVVYFLAHVILRDKIAAFFAALLFSVDAWILRNGASGLGFSLALLLAVVALWYGFRREYLIASLVSGFLILTAPLEGLLLFSVMSLDALAVWIREKALPGPLIKAIALALVPVLPWVVYVLISSGSLFTETPVATFTGTPFSAPSEGELPWYAASGGIVMLLLLSGHAVAVRRTDWRLLAPSSYPLLWAFLALGASALLDPDGLNRTWILVVPVIVIYGVLGLYYLAMFLIGMGRRSTVALLVVIVASLVANQAVYRLKVLPEMNRTVLEMQDQVRPLSHWLRSRTGDDDVILAPFGGMIGWISRRRVETNPYLWNRSEDQQAGEGSGNVGRLRSALSANRASVVVDRSSSGNRLEWLGLASLRTWGHEGIAREVGGTALYTVYAKLAVGDSLGARNDAPESTRSEK